MLDFCRVEVRIVREMEEDKMRTWEMTEEG